ncbi:hypothetical protein MK489_02310 [Myxococcota bacterium]|nr:hypothetical protein [Myxococcota bacterium]
MNAIRTHRGGDPRALSRLRSWGALMGALVIGLAAVADGDERGGPASRISGSAEASEYWDLTADLDSGHRLFARFAITHLGPGDNTAYLIGHVVTPEGLSIPFRKGALEGRWTPGPAGRFIGIGSSQLDQRQPLRRLRIDRAGIVIDLLYRPDPHGEFREIPGPPGYFVDSLHDRAPAQGTLQLPGMDVPLDVQGTIAATHTWMDRGEATHALRRLEVFSLEPAMILHLTEVTEPGGNRYHSLLLEHEGQELVKSQDFTLVERGKKDAGYGTPYGVPTRLTLSGPDWEGEVTLEQVLAKDDLLAIMPQPFRFLMSFSMKPRRFWLAARFEFRFKPRPDDREHSLSGRGIVSVVFTNPLPPEPNAGANKP